MTIRQEYEQWFRNSYKQEPMPDSENLAHDFCYAGWLAGSASRDAEITGLEAELEYDQRNAAMSQSESARLLDENTKLRAELEAARAEIEAIRSVALNLCGAMGLNEKWDAESTKSILHACINNYIEGLYLLRQGIRLLNGEK